MQPVRMQSSQNAACQFAASQSVACATELIHQALIWLGQAGRQAEAQLCFQTIQQHIESKWYIES